jgi:Tfp pilus assembly protein PilO
VKAKLAALDLKIQLAAIVVALGLVGFLGHMFVVSPQGASAAKIQQQIDDVQTQVYGSRALLKSGQHPPTIQVADLFRLSRAMPDREDMPGIMLTLSQVAQASGIKFDLIEPVYGEAPAVTTGSYEVRRVHLNFHGDFYGLSDFLYRVRSLVAVHDGKLLADGRLFDVDTLTFSADPGHFPKIFAELYVQAYVYTAKAPAAGSPGAAPSTTPDTTSTTPTSTTPTDTGTPPATPPESSPPGATAVGAS